MIKVLKKILVKNARHVLMELKESQLVDKLANIGSCIALSILSVTRNLLILLDPEKRKIHFETLGVKFRNRFNLQRCYKKYAISSALIPKNTAGSRRCLQLPRRRKRIFGFQNLCVKICKLFAISHINLTCCQLSTYELSSKLSFAGYYFFCFPEIVYFYYSLSSEKEVSPLVHFDEENLKQNLINMFVLWI